MAFIHVIIPVYNAEKYLADAVQSVLDQPFKGIDIVLVNDGSKDGSAALCDKLAAREDRIRVIHQENAGVSAARNAGIEAVLDRCAEEDYIAFLDADDLWVADTFVEFPVSEGEDVVGYSSYLTNVKADRFRPDTIHEDHLRVTRCGENGWYAIGTFAAYLYSCRLLSRYRLRFPVGVKGNEDIIFAQQVGFCSSRIRYCRRPLYLYRMNPSSHTHTAKHTKETAAHIARAWYSVAEWAESLPDISTESKKAWYDFCCTMSGSRILEAAYVLAMSGISYQDMCSFLEQDEHAFLFSFVRMEALAVWQRSHLELYRKDPLEFYRTFRKAGIRQRFLKQLLRIGFVRRIREARHFPLSFIDK